MKNTSKTGRTAISKSLRYDIFNRDRFTCQYCGRQPPEVILNIDHIIPVSKGGTNDPENLRTSCFACNSGKKAKLPHSELNPMDTLRRAQESLEAVQSAKVLTKARKARESLLSDIKAVLQSAMGRENIDKIHIISVSRIMQDIGVEKTLEWIDYVKMRKCHNGTSNPDDFMKYFHGVMRTLRERGEI